MRQHLGKNIVTLQSDFPIWERTFTVNSLVVVGTKEREGGYDLAPKHLATPMGWENYFGFVCTPRHNTYHNVKRERLWSYRTVAIAQPQTSGGATQQACGTSDGQRRDAS